jgi:site-specific DNA recombinase
MPIRCAVYARYSSDQQRPESIADQVRHCRQEAARHSEWVVLPDHVYTDEAISGVSVEGRAGLSELVRAALTSPRPFDLILVDDTSRLARDVVDSVRHFRELRFHGVDLYFVNQGLHSGRDNAEFLLAIYGAMDSEYIRELGRKTHRGLEGQARQGFSAGGIAFGFRREAVLDPGRADRDGQPRRLGVRWAVDSGEAETVRMICRWYADGLGMAAIAAQLNALGIPSPRQAKGHRSRQDSIGAGWDVSEVRVILGNELYRGRFIWNRSQWVRVPGTRRRRRIARPESEWVVQERPDLRIVDEALWQRVEARRARVRARYDVPSQFGKARAEYGSYLLSGRLVCGVCGGSLTIRTSGPHRYGCTRHWRRGPSACSNNVLVRRDLAEARIVELLKGKLYTPEAVARLVEAVNTRLRHRRPAASAERERLQAELVPLRRRLDGLRRFVEQGDTSSNVRRWLAEVEQEEERLRTTIERLDGEVQRSPLQVHPRVVEGYLQELGETLVKGSQRSRQVLQADVERIVIHPVRPDAAKPFARAEVITTGKGLLDRVVLVVAGARNTECYTAPETYWVDL